ncbi:TIGR02301 family protein [Maricaulis parjimensis]|uniref:TIGR02301 family protein n=1 Tax=Maricaulis parjimensis TaxID=144023 RepID=UPI00193A6C2F|nr:TIGR02301 family protein [Maricaulis parjimensis]
MRTLLLVCLSVLLLASPSLAQKPRGQSETDPSVLTEAPVEDLVDRERTLPYLAYTLGELHYLAYACEGPDVQTWRDRMVELLAMEAADNGRFRDRLIDSFNEGYRAQQRYRARCGVEADTERRALAHRGRDLSEMMRSAYFD